MNKFQEAVVAARADFEGHAQSVAPGSDVARICDGILADYKEHGDGLRGGYVQERVAELAAVSAPGQQALVHSAKRLGRAAQDNQDYF